MTYQIIQLNIDIHKDLFEHICQYLWNEWYTHYINLHGFKIIDDLYNMYRETPSLQIYAGINEDGHFIGCYSLRKINDIYWLTDVFVNPRYRNLGIGTSLIRNAIEGKTNIYIHVEPHLRGFYTKFGFEKEHHGYMKGIDGTVFEFYRMKYVMNDEMNFITYIIITIASIGLIGIIFILMKL